VFLAFSLTELTAYLRVTLLRQLTSNLVLGLLALGGFVKMLMPFIFLDSVRRAQAFSLDHAMPR